jgi:hypothetical protein
MFRLCILVAAVCLMWTSAAGSVVAMDAHTKLHFLSCCDVISQSHCISSVCRSFQAVHGNNSDEGVSYRLVSGPGVVDENTGMWCCEPKRDSVVPGREYWVEVEASLGRGGHYRATCRTRLVLGNQPPVPSPEHQGCDRYVSVRALDTLVMSFAYVDPDRCDRVRYFVDSVVPLTFARKSYYGSFFFNPSRSDTNKTFRFVLGATDGYDTVRCPLTVRVEPGIPDTALFSLRIPVIHGVVWGLMVDLPLYLDTAVREIGGFHFLIGFESRILGFNAVSPGEDLYDTSGCGWEYFTYRYVWDAIPDPPPLTGRVRLLGIAETNNGPNNHPRCLLPNTYPVTIARMQFLVTNDRNIKCAFAPVSFFWAECSDNVLQRETGQIAYHSLGVFDTSGHYAGPAGYPPSLTGVTDSCISYSRYGRPSVPAVNFRNGGIKTYCDDIDATGDINLNGVQYEFSDYVMFCNYFLSGISAFPHPAGSMVASDVNRDGLTLTIADLLQLYRIVIGLGPPPPLGQVKRSPNETHVQYDAGSGKVTLSTVDTLGAVWLKFFGAPPQSVSGPTGMTRWSARDGGISVLLAPVDIDGLHPMVGGVELQIQPPPVELIGAEVTTIDAQIVSTIIDAPTIVDTLSTTLPAEFTLFQNFPNPFNLSTTISFDLPKAGDTQLDILNLLGETVYTRLQHFPAGHHRLVWGGTGSDGRTVSSGIYYAKLTAGQSSAIKKMVLLK